jgi:hypothetical protein
MKHQDWQAMRPSRFEPGGRWLLENQDGNAR